VSDKETVAERLVHLLEVAGADVLFGIGGTHSLPFLGALERRGSLRFVAARNEQGASYMAGGFARSRGRPGVVVTSTGPGALNALSGIADARWSSLPLLHITTFADEGLFSGGIHESPEQAEVARRVGKSVFRIDSEIVDETFWEAWHVAQTPPEGPVTLEVFSRVWNVQARGAATEVPTEISGDTVSCRPGVESVVSALASATNPVIFAGGGVIRAGAIDSVVDLAERLSAPVVTSYQGKPVGDWTHPLYLGPWGSEPSVRRLFASADVAVVLGSKLSALSTGQWTLPLPATTFWIDTVTADHGRYKEMSFVPGDIRQVCDDLLEQLPEKKTVAVDSVYQIRQEVTDGAKARGPQEWSFVESLDAVLSDNAAVACDMNKASFWAAKYLPISNGRVQSFSSYLCMGSGVPAAIGMVESGRAMAVALVGDGSLQMSMAEMATIAERRCPIAIVVFVDGAYGLLRDNGAAEGVRGSRELGVKLWNPEFRQLADVYEFDFHSAATGKDLADALQDVRQPTLIAVPFEFSRHW